MPNLTPNLSLIKPLVTEQYDIAKVTNENADKIDLLLAPKANPTFTGTQTLPNIVTNGIKFPATQVPSADPNTLDDYEEGSWTPTIVGAENAGVGTYSTNIGKYVKIGKLVSIECYINWSVHTGTGTMNVHGLPFINKNILTSINVLSDGVTFSSGCILTGGYIFNGVNTINMHSVNISNGSGVGQPMDSNGWILLNGVYQTT